MPRMRGTIAGIHSEYSEVIDTARAESFFRDVPMPISRQVPSPVGTRSCFASKKKPTDFVLHKNPWRWHTIIKATAAKKKKWESQKQSIEKDLFAWQEFIFIYFELEKD